jgi:hypothetical protein
MTAYLRPRRQNAPLLPGLCASIAAAACDVPAERIMSATRDKARIADARHLAIYLQNVALCASVATCAALFARDRASARHALARIEDARDAPTVDFALERLEAALAEQQIMFRALAHAFASPETETVDERN